MSSGSEPRHGIIALEGAVRDKVQELITASWAGPMIVSRGKLIDTRGLPGYVYWHNDALVGYVLYQDADRECEIVVLESLREGSGVGTALVQAVLDHARAQSLSRVWLITTNDNTHAIRYYQRRCFSLAAVHINAMNLSRQLKPSIPEIGEDGIPILHEFEFEYRL